MAPSEGVHLLGTLKPLLAWIGAVLLRKSRIFQLGVSGISRLEIFGIWGILEPRFIRRQRGRPAGAVNPRTRFKRMAASDGFLRSLLGEDTREGQPRSSVLWDRRRKGPMGGRCQHAADSKMALQE
jgi:hypothetical protein